MWLIDRQSPMKAGWWDAPLVLLYLAKAIPIISSNGLTLLTENNFQTSPLLFEPPRLLIFRLSVGCPPPFIKIYTCYLKMESKLPFFMMFKIWHMKPSTYRKVNLLLVSNIYLVFSSLKNKEDRHRPKYTRSFYSVWIVNVWLTSLQK